MNEINTRRKDKRCKIIFRRSGSGFIQKNHKKQKNKKQKKQKKQKIIKNKKMKNSINNSLHKLKRANNYNPETRTCRRTSRCKR